MGRPSQGQHELARWAPALPVRVSCSRRSGVRFVCARMTAQARPGAERLGRRNAPASRCRVLPGAFACRLARASRGASGRALALALLAALLLQVPANDIEKKGIAQETACANGLNTITVTLQVTICSRNWNAKNPSRAARVSRFAPLESLKHPAFAPSPTAGGE